MKNYTWRNDRVCKVKITEALKRDRVNKRIAYGGLNTSGESPSTLKKPKVKIFFIGNKFFNTS